MSSIAEIESAVLKLPPKDLEAFTLWFESHRARLASTQSAVGTFRVRRQSLSRDERRQLALRAAEASARHYERRPDELLPDVIDDPA